MLSRIRCSSLRKLSIDRGTEGGACAHQIAVFELDGSGDVHRCESREWPFRVPVPLIRRGKQKASGLQKFDWNSEFEFGLELERFGIGASLRSASRGPVRSRGGLRFPMRSGYAESAARGHLMKLSDSPSLRSRISSGEGRGRRAGAIPDVASSP